MDLLLDFLDETIYTPYVYPSSWPPTDISRQALSILMFEIVGGYLMYFGIACTSYIFLFDKRLVNHPKFLPNQIRREITVACTSIPIMGVLTTPIFLLEIHGFSKLYYGFDTSDNSSIMDEILYILYSIVCCVIWSDFWLYWIHWFLHLKGIYKYIHKLHHTWLVHTPFAAFAFHPIDGWMQSLPYHSICFILPFEKRVYLIMFVWLQLWTFNIHDHNYQVPKCLQNVINGSAHHTDHHLFFYCNLGQFFTFWDKLNGTWKKPSVYSGEGPFVELERMQKLVEKTSRKGGKEN